MTRPDLTTATWQKSSYSSAQGQCVEVAVLRDAGVVAARDSKNPGGPAVVFASGEWAAFVSCVARAELNA
ncbi:DUF397 domain-containing protein [Streptomyces sp. MMS24-I29]|uniref:DUF397 domain-containing protein n=1 Tax=Streptomyces sp. MMS24-I29 TaxID=3351480 RepID=UPI003C7B629D